MLGSTWFLVLIIALIAIVVLYFAYKVGIKVLTFFFKKVLLPLLIIAGIIIIIFFVGVAILDTYFGTDIWISLGWF